MKILCFLPLTILSSLSSCDDAFGGRSALMWHLPEWPSLSFPLAHTLWWHFLTRGYGPSGFILRSSLEQTQNSLILTAPQEILTSQGLSAPGVSLLVAHGITPSSLANPPLRVAFHCRLPSFPRPLHDMAWFLKHKVGTNMFQDLVLESSNKNSSGRLSVEVDIYLLWGNVFIDNFLIIGVCHGVICFLLSKNRSFLVCVFRDSSLQFMIYSI